MMEPWRLIGRTVSKSDIHRRRASIHLCNLHLGYDLLRSLDTLGGGFESRRQARTIYLSFFTLSLKECSVFSAVEL